LGPLLFIIYNYLYTKIPLSLFKIKKEVIKGYKIIVYNIHLVAFLAYKSNLIFTKTSKKSEKVQFVLRFAILLVSVLQYFFDILQIDSF